MKQNNKKNNNKNFTSLGKVAFAFLIVELVSATLLGLICLITIAAFISDGVKIEEFVSYIVLAPFSFISLAWIIPMLVHYNKTKGSVGVGFKVCTLLFCGLIPGILMLCDQKEA